MPFYVIHEHVSTHNKTRLSVHPYILKIEFLLVVENDSRVLLIRFAYEHAFVYKGKSVPEH